MQASGASDGQASSAFGPRSIIVARLILEVRASTMVGLLDEVAAAFPNLAFDDFRGGWILADLLVRYPDRLRPMAEGCDVVGVGPQHVKSGELSFHRKKTNVAFTIPILPPLKAAIGAMPKDERHLTFLVTEHGKPFSAVGFGNKMREWCDEAGLPRKDAETGRPRCTPHGLRKSAATRFADRGATVTELMSWFGWRSPSEAIRYVEAADRRRAAKAAAAKLKERKRITKVSNSQSGLTK